MSQDVRKIFAANIKRLRLTKNIKREELSLLLGFDNSYISKLEHGRINITLDKIDKIANFFDVDIAELFK